MMNQLGIETVENATEPWEEFKCEWCGVVVRVNPIGTWEKYEYLKGGYRHINESVDCPKCYSRILRYPSK